MVRGTTSPHFLAHVYCGQTVNHLSNCWAVFWYCQFSMVPQNSRMIEISSSIKCWRCILVSLYSWNWPHTHTHTHTHNCFYGPFSGTTRVRQFQEESSSGLHGAREHNRGRHTDHPVGRHSIHTNQWPTFIILPFLLRTPFLSQSSYVILAWGRHQICWPVPSGLVILTTNCCDIILYAQFSQLG